MNGIDFALLKFCLEHNDSPNLRETSIPNRDANDYAWLREVMDSLPDPVKQMKECIKIIENDTDEETIMHALEILQDLVEDIDNANGTYPSFYFYYFKNVHYSNSTYLRSCQTWVG